MSRYKQIESAIETLKTGKENSIKALEELRMELMPQMTLSDWHGDIKSSIENNNQKNLVIYCYKYNLEMTTIKDEFSICKIH